MKTNIIRIGNSRGIIIPAQLLKKIGTTGKIEMQIKEDGLFLKPVGKPRQGWEEAAKAANREGDDRLLFPDVFEDENMGDWTW